MIKLLLKFSYSVSLCIQSKCGKMRIRITLNTDTFILTERTGRIIIMYIKFLLTLFPIIPGSSSCKNTTVKGALSQLKMIRSILIINFTKMSVHLANFNHLYYCLLGLCSFTTVIPAL